VQILGGLLVFTGVYVTTGMFEKTFMRKSDDEDIFQK
jgi:hypothetical protein